MVATIVMGLVPLMVATACRAQDMTGSDTVPPAEVRSGVTAEAPPEPAGSGFSESELDRLESGLDETEDLVAGIEGLLDEPVPAGD